MSTRFILAITSIIAAVMLAPCVMAADTTTADFAALATSGTAPFEVKINIIGWDGPYQLDYGDKFDLLNKFDSLNMTNKVNMVNSHRYKVPGKYTITMTLFGADGKPLLGDNGNPIKIVKTDYITVNSKAISANDISPRDLSAAFTFTQSTGSKNVGFQPLGSPYGGATAYYWAFGDGKFSNDRFPNHNYEKPGTYIPQLTVGNEYGSKTSIATGGPTITIPDTGAVGNGRQSDAFADIGATNSALSTYPKNTAWALASNNANKIMASDWYSYSR